MCNLKLLVGLTLLAVCTTPIGVPAAQAQQRLASATVRGAIQIAGCSLSVEDVDVRLRPRIPFGRFGTDGIGESAVRMAQLSPSREDPGALVFTVPRVLYGVPYKVGIRYRGTECGKVVWRVSKLGDFTLQHDMGASANSIQIVGYAITSELEILGGAGLRRRPAWVGADALEINDPAAAVRWFRWRTRVPGATGGVLQVSTEPFVIPDDVSFPPDPCETTGLVLSQPFALRGDGWSAVPAVDFAKILNPPGRTVPATEARLLRMGAPLYVRALPVDSDGAPICDAGRNGVPGTVIVADLAKAVLEAGHVDNEPIKVHHVSWRPPAVWAHPTADETCYRVIRDHYLDPNTLTPLGQSGFDVWNFYLFTLGKVSPGSTVLGSSNLRIRVPTAPGSRTSSAPSPTRSRGSSMPLQN